MSGRINSSTNLEGDNSGVVVVQGGEDVVRVRAEGGCNGVDNISLLDWSAVILHC
jgi:hypothetical protein